MYKMVIADDEEIIRTTLCSIIKWEELGIQIAGICKNGLEVCDVIIDEHPEIVIADIKMPGISGLELVERFCNPKDNLHFILLSGYGEFEYAKKAMTHGVKHYLLKPCNEKQIITAIEDTKKEIEERKHMLLSRRQARSIFYNLLSEAIYSGMTLQEIKESYGNILDFQYTAYKIYYIYFVEDNNKQECIENISSCMRDSYPECSYIILYVKNTVILLHQKVQEQFDKVTHLLDRMMFDKKSVAHTYESYVHANLESLLDVLIKKLMRFDKIECFDGGGIISINNFNNSMRFINLLFEEYRQGKISRESLKNKLTEVFAYIQDKNFLLYLITDILIHQKRNLGQADNISAVDFLCQIKSLDLPADIVKFFMDNFEYLIPDISDSSYKPFVEKILSYTKENLDNADLSLKWLASNYLYMNVNYIGKQFYKETGEKYSNYLNRVRMEKAKELLLNCENDKIYKVAQQVGCGVYPQYFCKLFKKYTGMTPSEYMEKR